jgi:hypothetical protein
MLGKFIGGNLVPQGGTASIQYLIVGGGGQGGGYVYSSGNPINVGAAGGGGAGEVIHDLSSGQSITLGNVYDIGVGIGGASFLSSPGDISYALGLTARGGARGGQPLNGNADGSATDTVSVTGGNLTACGGGGGGVTGSGSVDAGVGFLSRGGTGFASNSASNRSGGGGGGNAADGFSSSSQNGGGGGAGIGLNYKGFTAYYGGGGGGAGQNVGVGGTGGGASGSSGQTQNNGLVNTGGGGGGIRRTTVGSTAQPGGEGGSGFVVLKYPKTITAQVQGPTYNLTSYQNFNIVEVTSGTGTVVFYRAF